MYEVGKASEAASYLELDAVIDPAGYPRCRTAGTGGSEQALGCLPVPAPSDIVDPNLSLVLIPRQALTT